MRPRICSNMCRVKWLSANWRIKYRACRMRRPPVLKSRCWRLVRDQLWTAKAKASRRFGADNTTYLPLALGIDFGGCGGPQPLAGEQVRRVQVRDPDVNPCFTPPRR